MTWEQIERAMEFAVEQQARFDTRLTKLDMGMDQLRQRLDQLTEVVASNTTMYQRLAENQAALGDALLAMREIEVRTDERLNALIATVDKLINRNGHSNN